MHVHSLIRSYSHDTLDGYFMAYKPLTLPCISFIFIEIKFIHLY